MSKPVVSIVIPTRSRPEQLRACLRGIVSLEHDHSELEVIVVNDGGHHSLEPVLSPFRDRLALQLVELNGAGPAAARNSGNTLPDNPCSTASQLIATYVFEYYRKGQSREMFFTTNNFALLAERFRELGGFDTSIPSRIAEDKEFCDRWHARGYPMASVLLRRRRGAKTLIPEPLTFYRNLILSPTRDRALRHRWRYVLLLIAAQVATAAGALKASLLERRRMERDRPPSPEA